MVYIIIIDQPALYNNNSVYYITYQKKNVIH